MFQWRSARRTSGEKEGTWQKVPSSAGEGGEGDCISSAHLLTPHSHFVNGVSRSCFTHTAPLLQWTIQHPTHTPPTHLHSHSSTPAPPTHVDVHPQYAVGGPVLVQWVPTSHFGLRVEQEVVRKPEDQQWITVTANNNLKHIPCTIQHIQTNTVLVHTMCFVLRAWHGLQYEDTAHPPTTLLTHHSTTHISIAALTWT